MLLGLVALTSCAKAANSTSSQLAQEETESVELPEIPSDLRLPEERADYLIRHYWDKMDFTDTVKALNVAFMEQSFVNFLSALPYASSEETIKDGFSILLRKASVEPKVYEFVTVTAEDYLYNPNSPMLSEDQYILYLTALSEQPISESQLARVEDRLETVSKNRTGSKATDFSYLMPNGAKSTLYNTLPSEGTDLMLIFFDPECENCEEILGRLQNDDQITTAIKDGKMKVLAIYAGDRIDAWRRKALSLPETWTVGINQYEIDDNDLYYLPGMPTIYILNWDGRVKAKDVRY